jgi:hypothetical protein
VRPPAGVSGARVAQIVLGEAGLPSCEVELTRQFICQGFIVQIAVLLGQGNGGIVVFARRGGTTFDAGTFRFDELKLVQEVHGCGLRLGVQLLLVGSNLGKVSCLGLGWSFSGQG